MSIVLESVPVREAVDNFGGAIKESERCNGLRLVRREKVGCEVFQRIEEVDESLPHAVVGVV